MAKPKKRASLPARVRTAGLIGDESMQEMEDFNARGAGVDESKVRYCDSDPNSDLNDAMPNMKGLED
jgi:hypothetical protein